MTELEDRLRRLRGVDAPAGSTIDALKVRTRRRRARRLASASLATCSLVLGALLLWPIDDGNTRVDVVDGSTTSSPTTSTTTTTEPTTTTASTLALPEVTDAISLPRGVQLDPGDLVVSRLVDGGEGPGTNELSVISALDGSIVRTLASVGVSEGGITDIAISADRRTILATRGTSACTGELIAYAADGTGEPIAYSQFQNPLLIDRSPDGKTLAVVGDDDCDGLQTLTVWPIGEGTGPEAVFGDGGLSAGGLASDPDGRATGSASADDPAIYSVSYLDSRTLDVVVEPSGAHRIDLDKRTSTSLGLGNASYLGFTSTDHMVRLALIQSDTGPEFGVETDAGIQQTVALDEKPLDISSIGGEQVWVTPNRQLFRILEVNTVQLRDDVTVVG